MVADWHDGFVLRSEWIPAEEPQTGRYRLTLSNRTENAITGFRLGFSGPARINEKAQPIGASVVTQLSNYAEFAPPSGYSLAPGADWQIEIDRLDYPLRHWTDGTTTGFVILGDGTAVPALTLRTERAGSERYRRGTMDLPGTGTPLAIVPWPNRVAVTGTRSAPHGLAVEVGDGAGAAAAFRELTELLFPGEGLVREAHEDGFPVTLSRDTALAAEGYRLTFSSDRAKVEASTDAGFLYGLVTLGQIARGARHERQEHIFPASGTIEDDPAMGFRGCHLDVARRFYSVAEVSKFLAILAWNKLNRFHWHLSDDEAWRVEIEAYPRLTEIGAWRGHGLPLPPLLGSGPERTGGFYTKAEIAGLVALAGRFGIEVIPEIDVPGHCYALLQALPELKDPGENGLYHSIQSFPNNCLNPAAEAVYPALEPIFGEMAEMFPSRWFHVGADEVPKDAWATSPMANAKRGEMGVSGANELQAHFLRRIQAFLTSRGKITAAWEEAAHGGGIDKAQCYLVGWVNVEGSQRLAAEGYDVVAAPAQAFYMDMANSAEWHEPGAGWAGWSAPEKTYSFDPTAGWSDAERGHFLGVQGCIWSEPMTDRAVFDRLVFPRLSAIAETGWTRAEGKDFGRFGTAVRLMPNLYGRRESEARNG
ncbi:MAG TPA: beta-N-acetylhexosaminidase [Devosia sp.]|nr:beta-N-acetylhexosaminidase [Devosia sp.]